MIDLTKEVKEYSVENVDKMIGELIQIQSDAKAKQYVLEIIDMKHQLKGLFNNNFFKNVNIKYLECRIIYRDHDDDDGYLKVQLKDNNNKNILIDDHQGLKHIESLDLIMEIMIEYDLCGKELLEKNSILLDFNEEITENIQNMLLSEELKKALNYAYLENKLPINTKENNKIKM